MKNIWPQLHGSVGPEYGLTDECITTNQMGIPKMLSGLFLNSAMLGSARGIQSHKAPNMRHSLAHLFKAQITNFWWGSETSSIHVEAGCAIEHGTGFGALRALPCSLPAHIQRLWRMEVFALDIKSTKQHGEVRSCCENGRVAHNCRAKSLLTGEGALWT